MITRKSIWEKFNIIPKDIRIISKNNIIIEKIKYTSSNVEVNINASHNWYRGELWGEVQGSYVCISITGAIYFE